MTIDVINGNANGGSTSTEPARPRSEPLDEAIRLLEQGALDEAVRELEQRIGELATARAYQLLGTAHYRREAYALAAESYVRAFELDGSLPGIDEQLRRARTNDATNVREEFPKNEPHDREKLLGPPEPVEGVLPPPPVARPPQRLLARLQTKLRQRIGRALGDAVNAFEHHATRLVGLLGVNDEVWTDWYNRPQFGALLALAWTRQQLNKNNISDTYPAGVLPGFQSKGLVAPESARWFRTPEGTWNNLDSPKEGAAGVRFPRNVNRSVTWPKLSQLMHPNPAELSEVLFKRGDTMQKVPFLNLLAAAWIQFNVHDWVSHRSHLDFGMHEVPLPKDHPARKKYHQTKLFVGKTELDPTYSADVDGPPTYINEVTSWWDASQIYGSDSATMERLREHEGGRLKLSWDSRLPQGAAGLDDTGFNRNWWIGLSLLHTLFAREHNAICQQLARSYPQWDDNRLFHTARLVNAACIAKIHTVEWTPAILPNRVLQLSMNANWHGIAQTLLKPTEQRTALPWIKIANPEVGGIVGNAIDKHGKPFGLSDEFTEIYRLHDLLPDELTLRRVVGPEVRKVGLAEVREAGARKIAETFGMADLLFSFGNMHPGQMVLRNYPHTLRELSLPGNPVYDLAAVDILRARERGVPRYNEFRRQLGLNPIRRFEDLTDDARTVADLKRLYDNDLEAIDLLVGTRAESHRPDGYGFGETMFQLFILNASRRLQADRFYTDGYNEETYSAEGLAWIDRCSFKSVLLRHHPELSETGLRNVQNAFEPWDVGPLDPTRHPLTQFGIT